MNKGFVPASPRLVHLVARSMLAGVALLALAAMLLPAPLRSAADPGHAPNPSKSAWFLLWIQELVSHGTGWIYLPVLAVAAWVALPWLRRSRANEAKWFPRGERTVVLMSIAVTLAILTLTVVAMFWRGERWRLIAPF